MYYHSSSQIGLRDKNEDELDAIINLNNENTNLNKINFFGVYDGHGGPHISNYLKDNLSKFFLDKSIEELPSNTKCYNKYIFKIYDYIQKQLIATIKAAKLSGSTALVAIRYIKHDKDKLKIINLGDCRAVLCNENNIGVSLTRDHKPMSYIENHRILKINGIITQNINDDPRINGLSVSRAFGDLDATPHVSHIPEIFDYDVNGTKFLIMACDGVWDVLSNQDAVDFVLYTLDKIKVNSNCTIKSNKNIAYLLGEYAINKGSQDNISVLIHFL
jgi:serine/threonine protein phosphatase PrpC